MIKYVIFLFAVVIFAVLLIMQAKKRQKSRGKEKVYKNDNSTKTASQSEYIERKTTATTTEGINSSKTDFSVRIENMRMDTKKLNKYGEICPLIIITAFLMKKGFSFQEAHVGGGVDEIYHTGAKAYEAEYIDFASFRDNYFTDKHEAEEKAENDYGQWFTGLDYHFIEVELKKQSLTIRMKVFRPRELNIQWSNGDDSDLDYITEMNHNIKYLLGLDDELKKEMV